VETLRDAIVKSQDGDIWSRRTRSVIAADPDMTRCATGW